MAVQLSGSLQEMQPFDDEAAPFSVDAVVAELTRTARSPLRLAPPSLASRLVAMLNSPDGMLDLFERVSRGGSLQEVSDELRVPYYAIVSLFESPNPTLAAMRGMVRKALALEDRAQARKVLRDATDGTLTEDQKRFVDAGNSMSKVEDPAPAASHTTKVAVGVSFGDALAAHHKKARTAVVIEHGQGADDGGSELGL